MNKPRPNRNQTARSRRGLAEEQSTMDDVLCARLGKSAFVSVSDVAAAVEISIMTVLSWIHAKKIEAIEVSSGKSRPHYRILTASVLKFLKSRTITP
jgi:hypothetical protein